jgi:hypothetical protein
MADLTVELMKNFPHFQDETRLALARKLVALGLARSKYPLAQLFLREEGKPEFWQGLERRLREFEESTKGRRIPVPAWGHRRAWKELGPRKRKIRALFIVLGAPFAMADLINNSIPELCMQALVEQLAVDETEKMSLRFIISPVVLGVLYALQFWFLKKVVFEKSLLQAGLGTYVVYAASSFCLWYFAVHWRRQFKRMASLYFFRRAGVDGRSEAVAYYRALRQYLGDF